MILSDFRHAWMKSDSPSLSADRCTAAKSVMILSADAVLGSKCGAKSPILTLCPCERFKTDSGIALTFGIRLSLHEGQRSTTAATQGERRGINGLGRRIRRLRACSEKL